MEATEPVVEFAVCEVGFVPVAVTVPDSELNRDELSDWADCDGSEDDEVTGD